MFELTNAQRECFALPPALETWTKVEVAPSPYDMFYTYAYLDGNQIKKVILLFDEQAGHEMYREFAVDETLSESKDMLLPKTAKGKPVKFTSPNLLKRTRVGMILNYSGGCITLANGTSCRNYYSTVYDDIKIAGFPAFEKWVRDWCENTGAKEREELCAFASLPRTHQKYKEGDFFRYRINRAVYGYGRILLDFSKMRKEGIKFWDIFAGNPLCVAVYHIATENKDITAKQLSGMKTLPSTMIMDNAFYYGEYAIIANAPLTAAESDFPFHYGETIDTREKGVRFQHGRTYIEMNNEKALYNCFRNGGIGWTLNVRLPVLKECIAENSNAPYWEKMPQGEPFQDLRNPKNGKALARILEQVGEEPFSPTSGR